MFFHFLFDWDSNGNMVYKINGVCVSDYEPFSPGCDESGSEDYRYTGKPEDITGLYYFGARYYDPDTGRFITRDTLFGELSDPQSLNRYVYCTNNPHKYTDPDGRNPLIAWAIFAYIMGMGAGACSHAILMISDSKVSGRGVLSSSFSGGITLMTPWLGFAAGQYADEVLGPGASTIVEPAVNSAGDTVEYVGTQLLDGREIDTEQVITTITFGFANDLTDSMFEDALYLDYSERKLLEEIKIAENFVISIQKGCIDVVDYVHQGKIQTYLTYSYEDASQRNGLG